jgi:succinate-acetate transporter protein
MSLLAFTTAVLGCTYAGFIVPFSATGVSRVAVGVLLLIGGIIQVLAGMWEFRKENTLAATLFTAYGGFIAVIGIIFLPIFGIVPAGASLAPFNTVLGLLFLCWAIFNAVLIAGALKTNAVALATLVLLFATFVLLTIGQLAGYNGVLLRIGGWLGIATALVAWYTSLATLTREENLPLPLGPVDIRR